MIIINKFHIYLGIIFSILLSMAALLMMLLISALFSYITNIITLMSSNNSFYLTKVPLLIYPTNLPPNIIANYFLIL